MEPIRETFFNQEEWKYIQAVLKYRLDLHFYASQAQLLSSGRGLGHLPVSSAMIPSRLDSFVPHLSFPQPLSFPIHPPLPSFTLSPPSTPIKIFQESNENEVGLKSFDYSSPIPLNLSKSSSNTLETIAKVDKNPNPALENVPNQDLETPEAEFVLSGDTSCKFGCPYKGCDYKSNRKNNLQRHKETMHHKREVAFHCCAIRFFRRADFDKHKAEKHSQGYSCQKCDKHFERRATLARHERSHEKDTPFWCPYCFYRNGNESNNRRHIRKHEDFISQGINSHWNPFSTLGADAIAKEKLRPLDEIKYLLTEIAKTSQTESVKRKKTSHNEQMPDSTT